MPSKHNDWGARPDYALHNETNLNSGDEYSDADIETAVADIEAAVDLIQDVTGIGDRAEAKMLLGYGPEFDREELDQINLERRTLANLAGQYGADNHQAVDELMDLLMDVTEARYEDEVEYLLSPGFEQYMVGKD